MEHRFKQLQAVTDNAIMENQDRAEELEKKLEESQIAEQSSKAVIVNLEKQLDSCYSEIVELKEALRRTRADAQRLIADLEHDKTDQEVESRRMIQSLESIIKVFQTSTESMRSQQSTHRFEDLEHQASTYRRNELLTKKKLQASRRHVKVKAKQRLFHLNISTLICSFPT